MATLFDFCRGMSRPVNWYRLMLRHVANMWVCEQAMWARLSDGSFFDFFPFSRRTPRYYMLSALDFGEFKRFDGAFIAIWGNCPCLLTRLGFGMITVGTATFWLHLLVSPVATDSSIFIRSKFYCLESVEKTTLKARSIRLLYSSGEILELVAKRARDCKC